MNYSEINFIKEKDYKRQIYFKRVYHNIKNIGYHTTAIMEEENFTPCACSTGIFENLHVPELFVSGLVPNLSGQIIKD